MAFKRNKPRRRPFKRVVYSSKPIDFIDIRYRDDGAYQHTDLPRHGQNHRQFNRLDVEIRSFDVYFNGVWKGCFDNSPRGLIDFAEAMR